MPNSNASLSTYTTRMLTTKTGRPYAKDLHDLFAAMLIQLPLGDHRSLFRSYTSTFTTEEAVARLDDLKFTHVVRLPDSSDPSCQVATRTTTTFSMNRTTAKLLGQHFLNARLMESATDSQNRTMKDKGIWSPTPKGKFMIQDFSQRAHVPIGHMKDALARIDSFNVFTFERLDDDDALSFSRPNMTKGFKTMMAWLPVEKLMADDVGGIPGKDMFGYSYTFYGYQCSEWISEYTTAVSKDEADTIASEFVLYGWISQVPDKSDSANSSKDEIILFKTRRSALYFVTDKGCKILGWNNDSGDADTIKSESSGNLQPDDKEKITRQQEKHAERLLRDEDSTSESTSESVPAAVQATISAAIMTNHQTKVMDLGKNDFEYEGNESTLVDKHYDFGFKSENTGDPTANHNPKSADSDIDAITARLLDLRSQQYIEKKTDMVRNTSTTPNNTATSSDSGVEVVKPSYDKRRLSVVGTIVDVDVASTNRDSPQRNRLREVLEDPLARMCFREFMKANFCEENINFWVEYFNVRKKMTSGREVVKEVLSDCYAIYDSYLKKNALYEVNIDHNLRQDIGTLVAANFSIISSGEKKHVPFASLATDTTMTPQTMVAVNAPSATCLKALLYMYDKVNDHICRIMEQDSIPRFLKSEKYILLMSSRAHEPQKYEEFVDDDTLNTESDSE